MEMEPCFCLGKRGRLATSFTPADFLRPTKLNSSPSKIPPLTAESEGPSSDEDEEMAAAETSSPDETLIAAIAAVEDILEEEIVSEEMAVVKAIAQEESLTEEMAAVEPLPQEKILSEEAVPDAEWVRSSGGAYYCVIPLCQTWATGASKGCKGVEVVDWEVMDCALNSPYTVDWDELEGNHPTHVVSDCHPEPIPFFRDALNLGTHCSCRPVEAIHVRGLTLHNGKNRRAFWESTQPG